MNTRFYQLGHFRVSINNALFLDKFSEGPLSNESVHLYVHLRPPLIKQSHHIIEFLIRGDKRRHKLALPSELTLHKVSHKELQKFNFLIGCDISYETWFLPKVHEVGPNARSNLRIRLVFCCRYFELWVSLNNSLFFW